MFQKGEPSARVHFSVLFSAVFLLFSVVFSQEDYAQWKYWTYVTFNTSASGANVAGNVLKFPVLIRLTDTNFTFSQAKAGGADIRFSKTDGKDLPYEIERWVDGTGNNDTAELWVLIDTVYGNNSTQSIKMYWGNTNAVNASKPSDVFPIIENFTAVWHLNENPAGGTGSIKDRTSNGNNGTQGGNMDAADLVNGRIGKGIDFDGSDDYINVGSGPSIANLNIVSVSGWVYLRGWGGSSYGRLLSKTASTARGLSFLVSNTATGGFNTFGFLRQRSADSSDARAVDSSISLNGWIHLAAVSNGTNAEPLLYVNGAPVGSYKWQTLGTSAFLNENSEPLLLGNRYNAPTFSYDRPFHGIIDELRIYSNIRSANWIKLDHATQKSGQTTVANKQAGMPRFTDQPDSDTVYAGDTITFSVAVTGTPAPTVKWQRKQGTGPWDSIAAGATYLKVPAVIIQDTGMYRAIATNINGSATSTEVRLQVWTSAPTFSTQPQSAVKNIGDTVIFTSLATGKPPITYQWRKKQGTGAWGNISVTTPVCTLRTIAFLDSGFYRVTATNSIGSATSDSARLQISSGGPIITLQPKDTAVQLNKPASFTVNATGNPPPNYQWWRMKSGVWEPISGATSATYNILSVTVSDTMAYRARAKNIVDSIFSNSAYLYLIDSSLIIKDPRDTIVLAGDTAKFQVETQGTSLTYQWDTRPLAGQWQTMSGQTSKTLKFVAQKADSGTWYRAVVKSGSINDTSETAILTIGSVPVITSNFDPNAVFKTGKTLNLTGAATGTPLPTYKWCFINKNTLDTNKATGANLIITSLAKEDSGTYYFMARNRFATKNSDSIKVHVMKGLTIKSSNLPSEYPVLNGGAMSLTFDVTSDGTISYQWYWKDTIMNAQTSKSLSINPVDSATYDNTKFYCIAISSYLGVNFDTLKSNITTLKISKYTNPFSMSAERISAIQVRLKMWSDVDISKFPGTMNPFLAYADTLHVIYKTKGWPSSETGAYVAKYATNSIINAAPDSFEADLPVPELPIILNPAHDSSYYFSYSPLWRETGKPDTLLKPLKQDGKVFMLDNDPPKNPLEVTGVYKFTTDTAYLVIDSILKLNPVKDSLAVFQCCKDSLFTSLMLDSTVPVSAMLAAGQDKDSIILTGLGPWPILRDTIYCRWFIKAKSTLVESAKKRSEFTIGWDRPVYSGTLRADSTYSGDRVYVSWDLAPAGTQKIRIWWDTKPIDLVYNPSLSIDHAFDPAAVNSTSDTIGGFNYNTMYHFGLQIFKDYFWSVITPASSDSVKTAQIGTDTVINIIKIVSQSFDTVTNSMVINWNIDTTNIPTGRTYDAGYKYTLNTSLDSIPPSIWKPITNQNNITEIQLYPEITFDTSYTVGLWLRGKGIMFPGGLTLPSKPTGTSTTKVTIPSFTWQEVKIFPSSLPKDSVVYAANKKIILKRLNDFREVDTCKSYKITNLPRGFCTVGGVSFEFKRKLTNTPDFKIGLKHGALPDGITQADIGFYRIVDGRIYVLHGFDAGKRGSDSTVWYTMKTSPAVNDLKYPFVILADTLKPVITVADYDDTVEAQTDVQTTFFVNDNVANTKWQLAYGRGDQGYVANETGFMDKSFDSSKALTKKIDLNSVSDVYGVRARILAGDGIHADTVDISRQVRITTSEEFAVPAKAWVPLRTTGHLDAPKLDSVFYRSYAPDPWTYDIYECRLYRWHNPTSATDPNYWLEYSESSKSEFDFIPGRVIWCMLAEAQNIKFGEGVTTSLKQPYEIELKPKNWTDFSLPFQFSVHLRDVLERTEDDSLVIYYWKKEGDNIFADYVYKFTDTITTVKDILISQPQRDGYTVYNYSTNPVKLKIPPTCVALSSYGVDNNGITRKQGNAGWDLDVRWRNVSAGEQYFKRVICGYKNGVGEDVCGPLPPTMSKVGVGIREDGTSKSYGWVVKRNLDKNGGATYGISFNNNSGNDATIEYYLDARDELPSDIQARVYDTKGVQQGSQVSTVAVKAGNSATRLIAVGPESYFGRIFAGFLPMKLMKAYPNPFKGLLRIHYRIPFGIREVTFVLYNVQGKVLWNGVDRSAQEAGEHIYIMGLGRDKLPAGVYILRLSAKDARGKTVYGGEKRITCIK